MKAVRQEVDDSGGEGVLLGCCEKVEKRWGGGTADRGRKEQRTKSLATVPTVRRSEEARPTRRKEEGAQGLRKINGQGKGGAASTSTSRKGKEAEGGWSRGAKGEKSLKLTSLAGRKKDSQDSVTSRSREGGGNIASFARGSGRERRETEREHSDNKAVLEARKAGERGGRRNTNAGSEVAGARHQLRNRAHSPGTTNSE
ncbi:hypothetical protein ERJ75_001273400 [Trypanosoma vivax]|nr:hypothetical protein ERJ75_001273400 [Trypanosoma vivax]